MKVCNGIFIGVDYNEIPMRGDQFLDDPHPRFAGAADDKVFLHGLDFAGHASPPEIVGKVAFNDECRDHGHGIQMYGHPKEDQHHRVGPEFRSVCVIYDFGEPDRRHCDYRHVQAIHIAGLGAQDLVADAPEDVNTQQQRHADRETSIHRARL